MTEHAHDWRLTMHMDGCHWYASTYRCDCGATATSRHERDVKADGWSAIWMGEEPCPRCDELMAGAKPEHAVDVREADE